MDAQSLEEFAADSEEPTSTTDPVSLSAVFGAEGDDSNTGSAGNEAVNVVETVDPSAVPDEFIYTKRDDFTSELYKLSITNLPKIFGFKEIKKKLAKIDVKPVKLKVWKDVCFVTFRNDEEKKAAMQKINGLNWRGCVLMATVARPAADPLMRKRKQEGDREAEGGKKSRLNDDDLSPAERLKNSVTPLWKMEYKEQLRSKADEMREFFKRYHRQLEKECSDLRSWLRDMRQKHGAIPCELLPILPSPEQDGYRNKCEFTIGPGMGESRPSVVGFRYGTYAHGTVSVGSAEDVAFIPQQMKAVLKLFQGYLDQSPYPAFNPETHEGHWRQLTVRTSRLAHLMVMVDFHPQSLTQDTLNEVKESLKKFFSESDSKDVTVKSESDSKDVTVKSESDSKDVTVKSESDSNYVTVKSESNSKDVTVKSESDSKDVTVKKESDSKDVTVKSESDSKDVTVKSESDSKDGTVKSESDSKDVTVTSCYFRAHTDKTNCSDVPFEHLFGDKSITESLLGMKFQISPSAFFQVNTAGAEVLYQTVSDWCRPSDSTTVLDICCGTGTIGLTVAKRVSKVIGVEMCSQAVEDAKTNAQLNGVSNVEYHCAKAEDVIREVTRSVRGTDDVVAIVDPPRCGLHSSVIVSIRNCRNISRLVYVSCNMNGAMNNFIDLVRPTSKRLTGARFLPIKAVPVDLFPLTSHCELVVLFERESDK